MGQTSHISFLKEKVYVFFICDRFKWSHSRLMGNRTKIKPSCTFPLSCLWEGTELGYKWPAGSVPSSKAEWAWVLESASLSSSPRSTVTISYLITHLFCHFSNWGVGKGLSQLKMSTHLQNADLIELGSNEPAPLIPLEATPTLSVPAC